MENFMISIQEHLTDQEYTLLILMSRKLQNSTKYKMKSSICTQSQANKNKNRNDNRLANTLDKKLPSQNTRNSISEEQDFKTF